MIVDKILQTKASKAVVYPARSNRASEAGHPCALYLTYTRTNWQDRKVPDARLQLVFDIGNDVEERVIRDMKESGIFVIEQQRAFDWPEYQLTGTVDCKVQVDGIFVPCEIKSASPFVFDAVESVDQMLKAKYAYMRRYPAQLMLYMLMSNTDKGVFLFKNKSSGAMKEIWVNLDYDYAEGIIKKLETVNKHISAGTKPEPIEYDEHVCGDCAFAHICPVIRTGQEVEVVNDEEIEGLISRWDELKASAAEYKELDDTLKKLLEGMSKKVIGDYYVDGAWRQSVLYDVPKEVKENYRKEIRYWVKKIKRI